MLKVLIAEDEPLSLQNLSGQMRDLLGADALIEGVANLSLIHISEPTRP